jgi:hypothetical protein
MRPFRSEPGVKPMQQDRGNAGTKKLAGNELTLKNWAFILTKNTSSIQICKKPELTNDGLWFCMMEIPISLSMAIIIVVVFCLPCFGFAQVMDDDSYYEEKGQTGCKKTFRSVNSL